MPCSYSFTIFCGDAANFCRIYGGTVRGSPLCVCVCVCVCVCRGQHCRRWMVRGFPETERKPSSASRLAVRAMTCLHEVVRLHRRENTRSYVIICPFSFPLFDFIATEIICMFAWSLVYFSSYKLLPSCFHLRIGSVLFSSRMSSDECLSVIDIVIISLGLLYYFLWLLYLVHTGMLWWVWSTVETDLPPRLSLSVSALIICFLQIRCSFWYPTNGIKAPLTAATTAQLTAS